MRPLPHDKTHGIIHSVTVKKEDLDKVAQSLNIPASEKKRIRPGDTIHIVREAATHEIRKP